MGKPTGPVPVAGDPVGTPAEPSSPIRRPTFRKAKKLLADAGYPTASPSRSPAHPPMRADSPWPRSSRPSSRRSASTAELEVVEWGVYIDKLGQARLRHHDRAARRLGRARPLPLRSSTAPAASTTSSSRTPTSTSCSTRAARRPAPADRKASYDKLQALHHREGPASSSSIARTRTRSSAPKVSGFKQRGQRQPLLPDLRDTGTPARDDRPRRSRRAGMSRPDS